MSRQCMCGCDVHLAWKRPVSSEACRGLRTAGGTPSLHVGASEGFQSLCSHSSDSTLPPFSLQLRVFRDWLSLSIGSQFRSRLSLESHSWRRVGGRLIRSDSYPSSDSSVEMSDELASTLASIQEFMAGVSRRLDQIESSRQDPHLVGMATDETFPHAPQAAQTRPPGVSLGTPFHLADHYETIPPPTVTVPPPMVSTIEDTRLAEQEAKVERLESMMRQIRLQDGGLTWDDRDGIPRLACPPSFACQTLSAIVGIGCPKIHLRLYSTVMRAHGIDDAQLVALFPMSLSGAAQRWFASVEPSRLRTWEDVAREFLTQFAFSADIDVSRRELEATRQRSEESISSFVTRWRAKVAGMVDRPKEQDQIDMVLRNLQPRFARRLVGIPFQDLRSLVQAAFSVEEAIARGLWTDTTLPLTYQYQPDYAQEPYIAQTSMQPRPSHPRAATHPPPRPYAQRPARQFTPLGMTLTRAFEKLRDAGVIVPLAPRPLPHPIPPHFRYMSTACIIRFRGTILALFSTPSCDTGFDRFRGG
ncbi:hypothetical protein CK203_007420 [Vitis vinifera]|uniref:Retrotransposon gag domain-containing protein n=1 Tax=Vitis vinifera TaxID=29760 RepID=A0A438G1E3_VITVI|nr:hypothetical protein CK203_007420 [Vitis vinifera]